MIRTFYQGIIYIQAWEFVLIPVYLFIIFLISSRIKNNKIKREPVYQYYLFGLYAKLFGGLAFAMIYIYYYGGGDTMSYYETALAMSNMFFQDPITYFNTLFGPDSLETYSAYDSQTGLLVGYIYRDPKAFMVCRLISPLMIVSLNSYILTTILVSWVTYGGLWRLYLMFTRYFPEIQGKLAIAVLFIPSTVFWGAGIMKDSFTMAATGLFAYYIDHVFIRKNYRIRSIIPLVVSAALLISLKPYIFMIIFPGTLYWILNDRTKKIRNKLIMYMVLPMAYFTVIFGSYIILNSLGDRLGKFSLDQAFITASVSQRDLKSDYYEGNSFDIGNFEPSFRGAISKFLPATNAGLFRPYIWESNNVVMLISGAENLFLIVLTFIALLKTRIIFFITYLFRYPLVMFCLLFAICFAFMIGLSTSNFGALVRFKIPLLPFFVSGLYIVIHLNKNRKALKKAALKPSIQNISS